MTTFAEIKEQVKQERMIEEADKLAKAEFIKDIARSTFFEMEFLEIRIDKLRNHMNEIMETYDYVTSMINKELDVEDVNICFDKIADMNSKYQKLFEFVDASDDKSSNSF